MERARTTTDARRVTIWPCRLNARLTAPTKSPAPLRRLQRAGAENLPRAVALELVPHRGGECRRRCWARGRRRRSGRRRGSWSARPSGSARSDELVYLVLTLGRQARVLDRAGGERDDVGRPVGRLVDLLDPQTELAVVLPSARTRRPPRSDGRRRWFLASDQRLDDPRAA